MKFKENKWMEVGEMQDGTFSLIVNKGYYLNIRLNEDIGRACCRKCGKLYPIEQMESFLKHQKKCKDMKIIYDNKCEDYFKKIGINIWDIRNYFKENKGDYFK